MANVPVRKVRPKKVLGGGSKAWVPARSKQWHAGANEVAEKRGHVEVGSKLEQDYVDNLEIEIERVDCDFVKYVSDVAEFNGSDPIDTQAQAMNQLYNQQMMLACSQPLQDGVDPRSIARSIGMYAGMCLMSKDFRKQCGFVGNALYPVVDKMADAKGPGSFWDKQRERIIRSENDGRLPLTPKTAAIMKLGFARSAFSQMREPNADTDQVVADYNKAVGVLYQEAQRDGISMEDINRNERIVVGHLLDRDPMYKQMFNETAFLDVHKEELVKHGDKERWRGEFKTADNQPFTGGFSPRLPYGSKHHDMLQMAWLNGMLDKHGGKCDNPNDALDAVRDFGNSEEMLGRARFWQSMRMTDSRHSGKMMSAQDAIEKIRKTTVETAKDWFERTYPEHVGRSAAKSSPGYKYTYTNEEMARMQPGYEIDPTNCRVEYVPPEDVPILHGPGTKGFDTEMQPLGSNPDKPHATIRDLNAYQIDSMLYNKASTKATGKSVKRQLTHLMPTPIQTDNYATRPVGEPAAGHKYVPNAGRKLPEGLPRDFGKNPHDKEYE